MVEIILRGWLEKRIITKVGRDSFLGIDAYQRGQGSEKTCAIDVWGKLTSLMITSQFPGRSEAFINQWEEGIE